MLYLYRKQKALPTTPNILIYFLLSTSALIFSSDISLLKFQKQFVIEVQKSKEKIFLYTISCFLVINHLSIITILHVYNIIYFSTGVTFTSKLIVNYKEVNLKLSHHKIVITFALPLKHHIIVSHYKCILLYTNCSMNKLNPQKR